MTLKVFGGPDDPTETFTPDYRFQTVVQSAELELELVQCDAGFQSPGGLHVHPVTEAHYVLTGRFEFNLEGKARTVGPGEAFLSIGGQEHSLTCIEAGSLVKAISLGGNDKLGSAAEEAGHDHDHHDHHDHGHDHGHDHPH